MIQLVLVVFLPRLLGPIKQSYQLAILVQICLPLARILLVHLSLFLCGCLQPCLELGWVRRLLTDGLIIPEEL